MITNVKCVRLKLKRESMHYGIAEWLKMCGPDALCDCRNTQGTKMICFNLWRS